MGFRSLFRNCAIVLSRTFVQAHNNLVSDASRGDILAAAHLPAGAEEFHHTSAAKRVKAMHLR